MSTFKPGQKVTYANGQTKEKGIIKTIRDGRIYVVYGLNAEQWAHYQEYTAELSPEKFLTPGWNNQPESLAD